MSDKIETWKYKLEKYCAYQERCQYDIKTKCYKLKIPISYHNELIDHLIDENYFSDHRYAELFIQAKVGLKKDGINKIKAALFQKKIKPRVIEESLQKIDSTIYSNNIKLLLEKKSKTIDERDEFKKKEKLIRYMMGKGYQYDEFKSYMNK